MSCLMLIVAAFAIYRLFRDVDRRLAVATVDALAYLFFRVHALGLQIAQVFGGLWLFPWGLAAMRSGFIPRWIGAAIIIAGIGYVMNSAVAILIPRLAATVTPIGMAMGVGELAMISWLLFWGARDDPAPAVAAAR